MESILDIMADKPKEIVFEEARSLDLFKDYLNSINGNKKDVWDDNQSGKYSPYVVDMMFGRDITTVLYANEMNRLKTLPKSSHYHWLLYSVPKGRKGMAGTKKDKKMEADIKLVMEYYNYSRRKAMEALSILTKDNLNEIERSLDRGGR